MEVIKQYSVHRQYRFDCVDLVTQKYTPIIMLI
jgi:hypothetical protein